MMKENFAGLKHEIKKHLGKGRFILIYGKWWFVPGTYDIISRKYRFGTKIVRVPIAFKLKKTIRLEKSGLKNSGKSEQLLNL